ncbi:MAG: alpha/beta hydrolase [Bacteroidota bacterium]
MRLSEWKNKGSYLTLGSNRLFCVHEGQGPFLLLLHAYPTASWGWHKVWNDLSKRFTLIAPDLPGSGFSDKPKGSYSIFWLTDLIESVLEHFEVNEFHILAHAYGSTVGQELIARYGTEKDYLLVERRLQLLSGCFINGGLFPEATKTTGMQKFLLTKFGATMARVFPSPYGMFKKNFSATFGPKTKPTEEEMKEYWTLLTHDDGHKRVPEVIKYLTERKENRDRWVGALTKATIPLCLINSTSDHLVGDGVIKTWKTLLPNSLLLELSEETGHYPTLEYPDQVLKAYDQFLSSMKMDQA